MVNFSHLNHCICGFLKKVLASPYCLRIQIYHCDLTPYSAIADLGTLYYLDSLKC